VIKRWFWCIKVSTLLDEVEHDGTKWPRLLATGVGSWSSGGVRYLMFTFLVRSFKSKKLCLRLFDWLRSAFGIAVEVSLLSFFSLFLIE
jgi:hypothetical protein